VLLGRPVPFEDEDDRAVDHVDRGVVVADAEVRDEHALVVVVVAASQRVGLVCECIEAHLTNVK